MTITKQVLTEAVQKKLDVKRVEASRLVETVLETMAQSLERGEDVKVSGFGNFHLRQKGERPGRNPKTGEDIAISARTVVSFKPSAILRDKVNV